MKTPKIKDVEQAFEEIIKEKPLIEEIKISTNPDIYELCVNEGISFYGKKMHQALYNEFIRQLKEIW